MPFRWACWYFPSVCQSVGLPVMLLIRPGILARGLLIPFFPSRAKETVIGLTHGYRYSVPLPAVLLPACFSIYYPFKSYLLIAERQGLARFLRNFETLPHKYLQNFFIILFKYFHNAAKFLLYFARIGTDIPLASIINWQLNLSWVCLRIT